MLQNATGFTQLHPNLTSTGEHQGDRYFAAGLSPTKQLNVGLRDGLPYGTNLENFDLHPTLVASFIVSSS